MFKNLGSQKITVFAWDNAAGAPKTGDSANITAQISKDALGPAATVDPTPLEVESTDLPGIYVFSMSQNETDANMIILSAVSSTPDVDIQPVIIYTHSLGGDADALANLLAMYDGTGLSGDKFPVRQDQLAGLAGGLGVSTSAIASTVTQGTETLTYAATAAHDDTIYVVTDSGAAAGIDFYLTFNTGSSENIPTGFHMHGWFQDGGAPFTNTCAIQVYNWAAAAFQTVETLTHATAEEDHAVPLLINHVSDGDVGTAGDVRVRFLISSQEASSTVNIDHAAVTYGVFVTAAAFLTEQMVESYAADGVAPTITQALFLIQQLLSEFVIAAGTYTIYKLDGVTPAATLTLNDATNPTGATRES